MTERYGKCGWCNGIGEKAMGRDMDGSIVMGECGLCGGTGHSGAVEDLARLEQARNPDEGQKPDRDKNWDPR